MSTYRTEIIGNQTLMFGDCREVLPMLADASVDCVVTDPPYPCIKRSYGYWTEEEWHSMMDVVVPECRRILTPTGSAVYVLQPNSEKIGRMRPWLWEFMAKWTREWGMVQDAWWWNITSLPEALAIQGRLMRTSVKACVWLGEPVCYRNQENVLWSETEANVALRAHARAGKKYSPSGQGKDAQTLTDAAVRRGGVTPYNLLPIGNNGPKCLDFEGHGAGTPLALCDWWLRYICPEQVCVECSSPWFSANGDYNPSCHCYEKLPCTCGGTGTCSDDGTMCELCEGIGHLVGQAAETVAGTVLEPFMGSGTVLVAAELQGKRGVGIESIPEYFDIACRRVEAAAKSHEWAARGLKEPKADGADDDRQTQLFDVGGDAA